MDYPQGFSGLSVRYPDDENDLAGAPINLCTLVHGEIRKNPFILGLASLSPVMTTSYGTVI